MRNTFFSLSFSGKRNTLTERTKKTTNQTNVKCENEKLFPMNKLQRPVQTTIRHLNCSVTCFSFFLFIIIIIISFWYFSYMLQAKETFYPLSLFFRVKFLWLKALPIVECREKKFLLRKYICKRFFSTNAKFIHRFLYSIVHCFALNSKRNDKNSSFSIIFQNELNASIHCRAMHHIKQI